MTKWALLNNDNIVVSTSKKKFEAAGKWKQCADHVTRGWYLEGSKLVEHYNRESVEKLKSDKITELKSARNSLLDQGFLNGDTQHFADNNSSSLAIGKLQLLELTSYSGEVTWDGFDPETAKRKRQVFSSVDEFKTFVIKMGLFVEEVMQKYLNKTQELEALTNKKDIYQFNTDLVSEPIEELEDGE